MKERSAGGKSIGNTAASAIHCFSSDWTQQELESAQRRGKECAAREASTADESPSGRQQVPSGAMPAGSKEEGPIAVNDAALAAPEAGAEEGSEDEAPEEMSLATGRLAAERQVQEEKKERAEGKKTSKKKRRRTAASG